MPIQLKYCFYIYFSFVVLVYSNNRSKFLLSHSTNNHSGSNIDYKYNYYKTNKTKIRIKQINRIIRIK